MGVYPTGKTENVVEVPTETFVPGRRFTIFKEGRGPMWTGTDADAEAPEESETYTVTVWSPSCDKSGVHVNCPETPEAFDNDEPLNESLQLYIGFVKPAVPAANATGVPTGIAAEEGDTESVADGGGVMVSVIDTVATLFSKSRAVIVKTCWPASFAVGAHENWPPVLMFEEPTLELGNESLI